MAINVNSSGLTIRIKPSLKEKIALASKFEKRSATNFILKVVEDYCDIAIDEQRKKEQSPDYFGERFFGDDK